MTESSAASDDGQAQRLSRDSNKSTHSPAPQPVTSVQLSLTAEQETLTVWLSSIHAAMHQGMAMLPCWVVSLKCFVRVQAAELLSRSLVSLSQRPRKATLGTDYSFQDDLDEEDSKCNMARATILPVLEPGLSRAPRYCSTSDGPTIQQSRCSSRR